MSTDFNKAWNEFRNVAARRLDTGACHLVPVVGSGFNMAATRGRERDSWFVLLKTIRKEFDLPRHRSFSARLAGHSMTALWEWFVSTIANQTGSLAFEAENQLRKKVQEQLKGFEERNRDIPFYRDFLACGFADVLSLNFDRTLALSVTTGAGSRIIQSPGIDTTWNASLLRHAVLAEAGQQRVWYPHGDTQAYKMIKLGIRDYGVYIESLNDAFSAYKQAEGVFKDPDAPWSREAYRAWAHKVRQLERVNWLWLLLSSPVVFLGCGMTRDEWPMWWALHQRARNQARLPSKDRDPVFILWNVTVGDPNHNAMTEWLRTAPAGIRLLPCYDWGQGWNDFFAAFKDQQAKLG